MKSDLLPQLGYQTYVMGIINLTPDSFSGDGLTKEQDYHLAALAQAQRFIEEGADLIDLGAESTRPGSAPISSDEEIERLLPVIYLINKELPQVILSVDTYKAETARACLAEGVQLINDIWGFQHDPEMAGICARYNATVVLMHNRQSGAKAVTSNLGGHYEEVVYEDILDEVRQYLQSSINIALEAGLPKQNIIIDPGIGFGKTIDQNLYLLKNLKKLTSLGYPLLLGVSRKGFIGYTLNLGIEERLEGSLAGNAYGVLNGADILRVHDVRATVRLARMLDAIRLAE